jgi:hypothetical protein
MQISLRFLFLVVLVGTTTTYAQERSSTPPPPQSPQTKPSQVEVVAGATVSPSAVSLSPEERIIRLEERINFANERSQNAYNLLQFVGIFAALVLAFFSIRDVILRRRQGQRQRGIDEIIKDMMNLQKTALDQQVRVGQIHLDQVEASPKQQFEAVQKVNQVIEVVRQTLDFRLQQEAKVAEVLADIQVMKAERDIAKQQKLTQARAILDHFEKMSRMQFATLTDEQRKRGIRLQELVNDLANNFDEFVKQQGFEVVGKSTVYVRSHCLL